MAAQTASSSVESLPDAPDAAVLLPTAVIDAQPGGVPAQVAPKYALTIQAGQTAEPLTVGRKFGLATHKEFRFGFFTSPAISAGFSHLIDSRPHFGTDKAGFGERYGAAAYRRIVENYSTNGVYASVFHDDPRYYVLGPQAPIKRRVIYAATRIVIARKDDGGRGINWPAILGPATAQAAAVGFYPGRDRDASRVFSGTGTSLAINAGLNVWSEFSKQILGHLHHK